MTEEHKIQIIKHIEPEPLREVGDILYPFANWETTSTGDGWYTRFPEEFYEEKPYYPLTEISQNPWDALIKLGVNCFDFKEKVQYECPYNKYIHFWCIPVIIFSDNIELWINKYNIPHSRSFCDQAWAKKFFPVKTKNGLPFTKIQRSLLGPGYTSKTLVNSGNGYLYDSLLVLDNGDYLGAKVWIWFSKK
jgi:hypothetical protein